MNELPAALIEGVADGARIDLLFVVGDVGLSRRLAGDGRDDLPDLTVDVPPELGHAGEVGVIGLDGDLCDVPEKRRSSSW